MYLLILSGQGDIEYKLVGPETWKWLDSPSPLFGPSGRVTEQIPASALTEMQQLDPQYSGTTAEVTASSWDNDRALHAGGITFYTLKEVLEWLRKNKETIDDEYTGEIY